LKLGAVAILGLNLSVEQFNLADLSSYPNRVKQRNEQSESAIVRCRPV